MVTKDVKPRFPVFFNLCQKIKFVSFKKKYIYQADKQHQN